MTDTAPPPPPPGTSAPEPPPGPGRPTVGPFAGTLSTRTLRRSRSDRKVAGVAGGLGRWLDVDPVVVRVLLVVLAFFGGAGLVLYVVAWLVVPEEGDSQGKVPTGESVRNAVLLGALAVTVFVAFGADWSNGNFFPWPLFVLGLVATAFLLGRDGRRSRAASGRPGPDAPPPPAGPTAGTTGTEPTVVLEKPARDVPPPDSPGWYPPAAATPPPPPRAPRRTGPLLFFPTVALVALALGVLGVYDATGGAVASAAYPALALAVIGLLLVVGAFVGRPGGLVLLGLVAAVSLLFSAVVDPAYSGPRDLTIDPTSASTLDHRYHVPAGRIQLDLTNLDPATLDGLDLDLSVGAGEVVVLVPPSVEVDYTASIGFGGHIAVDGRSADGWSPELSGTVRPPGGATPKADLGLSLSAQFGQVQVVRS